jgi:hypothetical protein
VFLKDLGNAGRHRTVQEDPYLRYRIFEQQIIYVVQDFLRALQSEAWDDDIAAGLSCGVYYVADCLLNVLGLLMYSVAVGGPRT